MGWVLIVSGVLLFAIGYLLIAKAQRNSMFGGLEGRGDPVADRIVNQDVPGWYRLFGWIGTLLVVAGIVVLVV